MAELWVGCGWKMNKTLAEARAYTSVLRDAPEVDPRLQRFVVPPFTVLREVADMLAQSTVRVGAQNMHWARHGAWTGEISAPMLRDCGADLVEIGHSERRTHFGETDETVGLKVEAALTHGLLPLICVGEASDETVRADEVLIRQVSAALAHAQRNATVVFAYEPVWAIGEAGAPADPSYAQARHRAIKTAAEARLHTPPRVLYGGSVGPGNAVSYIEQPDIDGLFIGRAAWAPEGYLDILRRVSLSLPRRER